MSKLVDSIGTDRVLFGSDFPHPEGLGTPLEFERQLERLPDDVTRKVMGQNLRICCAWTPSPPDGVPRAVIWCLAV